MSIGRVTYCTQFDSQYLARGMAMLRSLCRWDRAGAIRVLALDSLCARVIREVFAGQVEVVSHEELVAADPVLQLSRQGRSDWEYYATLKPAFLCQILSGRPRNARVVFIDADTWFFSSPESVWQEMGEASIGLSPHAFSEENRAQVQFGTYNAGFLCFRADEAAAQCLWDWRSDCLAWCGERPGPDGRFMNQGYLNAWPERYTGVHVISHAGYNLAPWNVNGRQLELRQQGIYADGQPLVFYHFSQTHRDQSGKWYSLQDYFPRQRELVVEAIYRPYVAAVEGEGRLLLRQFGIAGKNSVRPVVIGPQAVRVDARI